MKRRFRPHQIAIGQAVVGNYHRTRGIAVHRVGLVIGARHQRRECQFHALCGVALEDVAVERIEGEKILVELPSRSDLRKQPALRCGWIHEIEMREVWRILQVAERGNAVTFSLGSDGHAQR